jgi:hypothetical protein
VLLKRLYGQAPHFGASAADDYMPEMERSNPLISGKVLKYRKVLSAALLKMPSFIRLERMVAERTLLGG